MWTNELNELLSRCEANAKQIVHGHAIFAKAHEVLSGEDFKILMNTFRRDVENRFPMDAESRLKRAKLAGAIEFTKHFIAEHKRTGTIE